MKEEWRKIKNYQLYEISNFGRIRSYHRSEEPYYKSIYAVGDKLAVKLRKNGKDLTKYVARLVYESFNDAELKNDDRIGYFDGDTYNCELSNLYLKERTDKNVLRHYIPVVQYENKNGGLTTTPTAITLVTNRTSITKLEDPVYQKEQADKLFEYLMVFCPHGIFQKLKESILKFDDGLAKLKEKKKLNMNKYNKPYLINSNQIKEN